MHAEHGYEDRITTVAIACGGSSARQLSRPSVLTVSAIGATASAWRGVLTARGLAAVRSWPRAPCGTLLSCERHLSRTLAPSCRWRLISVIATPSSVRDAVPLTAHDPSGRLLPCSTSTGSAVAPICGTWSRRA